MVTPSAAALLGFGVGAIVGSALTPRAGLRGTASPATACVLLTGRLRASTMESGVGTITVAASTAPRSIRIRVIFGLRTAGGIFAIRRNRYHYGPNWSFREARHRSGRS